MNPKANGEGKDKVAFYWERINPKVSIQEVLEQSWVEIIRQQEISMIPKVIRQGNGF